MPNTCEVVDKVLYRSSKLVTLNATSYNNEARQVPELRRADVSPTTTRSRSASPGRRARTTSSATSSAARTATTTRTSPASRPPPAPPRSRCAPAPRVDQVRHHPRRRHHAHPRAGPGARRPR
ncbi:hypothetical protein ACRAWF_12540 [Streptomyces sp. L7]